MNWFIFLLLGALLILNPYQRGLYFSVEFYSFAFLIYSLFVMLSVRLFVQKEVHLIKAAFFAFIFPLCYGLSFISAQHPQGAWDSLFRWIAYSAFFVLLYWTFREERIRKFAPAVFHVTGIWVAFHMLFVAYGWLDFPRAVIQDRFAGVLQYPNTFGMLMAAFLLFALLMLTKGKISLPSILFYSFPLVVFVVCFIESYSRGMYLMAPITWLVGLLLLRPTEQVKYILFSSYSLIAGLVVVAMDRSFVVVLIGTLITIGLSVATIKWVERGTLFFMNRKKIYHFAAPVGILVIGLLGVLDVTNNGLVYQQLPTNVQERIDSISESTTARERYLFMQDALTISKDSPVIGHGGEAWASIYRHYQQLPYLSNKIHNGFMEWIVDIGWLGFFVFVSLFGYLYVVLFKNYRQAENKSLYAAIIISTITIFTHSFIDFNLSYGTIWLLVFWLFAIGFHREGKDSKEQLIKKPAKVPYDKIILGISTALVLFCFVMAYRFLLAEQAYNEARQTQSLFERQAMLEQAVSYNPNKLSYWYLLSETSMELISQNNFPVENKERVQEISGTIRHLEPTNSLAWFRSGVMLDRIGLRKETLNVYLDALEMDEYDTVLYQNAIFVASRLARDYAKSNQEERMVHFANVAVELFQRNSASVEEVLNDPIGQEHNSRGFAVHSQAKEDVMYAYYLLGEGEKIVVLLDQMNEDDHVMPLVAMGIFTLEGLGLEEEASALFERYKTNEQQLSNRVKDLRRNY
ncbi:O-antigen ligase family protein [Alkalihalobacillus sp. MEB130]|uniref:O-antigen ligase family protein n=1 Tax=Alkalihalobacillus sp. MEB130 TaxID=2976704 RepID=UPI0028DE1ED0|nr:O-antigen ligase family protein [Alkalihalobacillus sp. MEB130]MDT8858830.1 O-antigen ligase family protein [Alkalihalobacillus sp. MEB130]